MGSRNYVKGKTVALTCPICKKRTWVYESTLVSTYRRGWDRDNWPCSKCRKEQLEKEVKSAEVMPGHNGCHPVKKGSRLDTSIRCRGARGNNASGRDFACPAYESCLDYASKLNWPGWVSNGIDWQSGDRIYKKGEHGPIIIERSGGLEIFSEVDHESGIARSSGTHGGRGGLGESVSSNFAGDVY